jgi:cytochrome c
MKRVIVSWAVSTLVLGIAFAAEDGAAIYKAKCAHCHGSKGEGKMGQ